jgi:hypothetical protein
MQKVTGYICDPEPESFAKASLEILKPDQKEVMGRLGRKRVLENFSLDSFTEKLDSKIKDVMKQRNEEAYKTWMIWNSVWLIFVVQLVFAVLLLRF